MKLQSKALIAAMLAACASSQVRTSTEALSVARLRDALAPSINERIALLPGSEPRQLPGVTCVRATRTPVLSHAEDARPRVAAMIITSRDTVLVVRLADLTTAWRAVSRSSSSSPRNLESQVTALFRCSGLVYEGELISSLQEVQAKAPRQAFRSPSAVDAVVPPTTARDEAATIVIFYASMPTGLYRYRARVGDHSGELSVTRELLSALKMRM